MYKIVQVARIDTDPRDTHGLCRSVITGRRVSSKNVEVYVALNILFDALDNASQAFVAGQGRW